MGKVKSRAALWLFYFALLCLLAHSAAAAKRPNVDRTWFGSQLTEAQYFDDSDVILVTEPGKGAVHKSVDGGSKWEEIAQLSGKVLFVIMNPHSKKVAVALGKGEEHYITKDQGSRWDKFDIEGLPAFQGPGPILSFHADDEDRIIMNTITREGPRAVYTTDGFEDPKPKVLRHDSWQCLWANEQRHFTSGNADIDKNRALCVVNGKYSIKPEERRLMSSDTFFKEEKEPGLDDNRPVPGIVSVVTTKAFVLAARAAPGTREMALYVTIDSKKWHRASFGDYKIQEASYTVMESTNYSLQVDVATRIGGDQPMGSLFTSNSLGYSFVRNEQYTNRNGHQFVDFEKIKNIQGIALVNIVANPEDVLEINAAKKVKSQITFDDGRTFEDLKADGETLHLHSVSEPTNVGNVFSSLAPGIAMGIGNTGPELRPYSEGDLYVSDNAGLTWTKALSGPHKYEFGDQGSVLLAIADGDDTGELSYSIDFGKTWTQILLKDYEFSDGPDVLVKPSSLTTLPDSTSLKFVLKASAGRGSELHHYIYVIDFEALDMDTCKKSDFEEWYARKRKDGEPRCIMGHKQKFLRRKASAKCFVGKKFIDPVPENKNCVCRDIDYECDEGFQRSKDRKSCNPLQPRSPPDGACKKDDETFEDISGFRIIPGNTCEKREKLDREKPIQRKCSDAKGSTPPSDGKIATTITPFEADHFQEYYYLERPASSEGEDETVIMLTNEHTVHISNNHGKNWKEEKTRTEVAAIYPHRFMSDQVYLITNSKTVYYSKDRGRTVFKEFEAPLPPNNKRIPILHFHPKNEDWLIWTSCSTGSGESCDAQAHVSRKNGGDGTWNLLKKAVGRCDFVWRENRNASQSLVYCMQHEHEDPKGPFDLLSSDDWFEENQTVLFKDMIAFATMSDYIVVAAKEGKQSQYLKVDASVDGKIFADAKLPSDLQVPHTTSYTVLDSSTKAIFLFVTVNNAEGKNFGTIVKSNSNGTSYTISLDMVNSDAGNYVDFEKMLGLEGVAVANVVSDPNAVVSGMKKKLKTLITYDDGATWSLIAPPKQDAEGNNYKCASTKKEKCSLHLHGYTERIDRHDTYSSPSAVGLVIGIGNVGEELEAKRNGHTFISRDGGVSWKTAMNGQYMWEFGDRGAIIVLVLELSPTKVVYYSQDEGEHWTEYQFSDDDMIISDITTVPSDTSRNFMLWGKTTGSGARATTVNLDFSGLASRKCEGLDKPGKANSDYDLWEPNHPDNTGNGKDNCLFGHVSQYIRKKIDRDCYNPPNFPAILHNIKKNCTCTRQDFECDYNFVRRPDGSCKLAKGLKPIDPMQVCKQNPELDRYYEPTGYRRLPLSTCEGGKEFDRADRGHACPGKEEEFNRKEGISGAGLFFAIVIPIAAAAAVGWWMWRNLDGRFGQIRLGDGSGGSVASPLSNGSGRGSKILVKYPVMVVSGVVAVAMAVPMVFGVLWRSVRERLPGGRRSYYSTYGGGATGNGRPYTSRDSFSRAGRDYSDGPHNDERDLLGEDSDDEA